MGSRKNPIWRVVVADQRSPRDGRVIETIGRYNAQTEPSEIVLDHERLQHWLDRGAQPSNTVRKLMRAKQSEAQQSQATAEVRVSKDFHDRYVFIDRGDCYQSGASFKDGISSRPDRTRNIGTFCGRSPIVFRAAGFTKRNRAAAWATPVEPSTSSV